MSATGSAALAGIGRIAVEATADGLVRATILSAGSPPAPARGEGAAARMRDRALAELAAYAQGGALACPVALDGLPPFIVRVLTALRRIPRGEVIAYGALAALAGSPGAARAVGTAMARNPIPLWIPCHRVVAAHGLGGYSGGGGLPTKQALLRLEGYSTSPARRSP